MTALVLNTLSQFKLIYDLQTEINNAASYLLSHQNSDGSFGEGTVYETALAFEALIASGAVGAENYTVLQNAIAYLTSTQLPNGSWNDDPYSTALALRALANVKPNLSISSSDITYTPSVPTIGDTVTITATVKNNGITDANNVTISFYNGDPDAGGTLIDEATILNIPRGGSGAVSVNWITPTSGIHNIFVLIDPADAIAEGSESDNLAIAQIRIYEKIDFTIQ